MGPLFETEPESGLDQPAYLNSAACGTTLLGPEALLAVLKRIEAEHGRRPAERNAPRPLDLDLLLFADRVSDDPELTLPHPRLATRRFVLAPLAAIAPQWRLPPEGRTVAELLDRLGPAGEMRRLAWSRESPAGAGGDGPERC